MKSEQWRATGILPAGRSKKSGLGMPYDGRELADCLGAILQCAGASNGRTKGSPKLAEQIRKCCKKSFRRWISRKSRFPTPNLTKNFNLVSFGMSRDTIGECLGRSGVGEVYSPTTG